MKPTEEIQQVTPVVWYWEAYAPEVKADHSSCAVRTAEGLVLIDPIPLAEPALQELFAEAPPIAIVMTNGNHLRAAESFRERFNTPLLAHAEAAPQLGITPDRLLRAGELVAGELEVIAIDGAPAGEIALHRADASLHVGDALINLPSHGFAPLPAKYCRDFKKMVNSLRALLPRKFDLLTFAHGTPMMARANERLAELLG